MRIVGQQAVWGVSETVSAPRFVRAVEPSQNVVDVFEQPQSSRQALVMRPLDVSQGSTSACGTVSLWLALRQFGRSTQTWQQLDAELRPWPLGSSPGVLAEAARARGLAADVYNHGSFEVLERETNAGRAMLVMADVGGSVRDDLQPGDPNDFSSHWMRVTRAWKDASGQRFVEYDNPWGTREVLRFEQFDELWRDQRMGGLATGFDRTYVLIDRPESWPLPASNANDVAAVMATTDGAQNFVRGLSALSNGDGRAVGLLAGGAVQTVIGAVGSALALPGAWLQQAGEALLEHESPVAKVAGAIVTGLGAAIAAVGNTLGLFASLFQGLHTSPR